MSKALTTPALYIVATPIGNLEDITVRALSVLSSVDLILCEDTRVTVKLLARYSIQTPLVSFNARSEKRKIDHVLALLVAGKTVALVSDAGTPTISDPGTGLISVLRTRLPELPIVAIPGPSALLAALSISGLPSSEFVFLGFLPHKKGRQKLFSEITASERTTVFYESPHRIMKTLESLSNILPASRRVVIARELTKVFEEVFAGSAAETRTYFSVHTEKQRGEFVVLVSPR